MDETCMETLMETRELASIASRLVATLLDTMMYAGTLFLAAPVLHKLTSVAQIPALGGVLLILLAINFEAVQTAWWGRTLGHRICGLVVINSQGGRPNYFQALVRWILKIVLGVLNFITMLSRNGKAIHDTATRTSVVYE
jgi:uncharacterized RDD family membrane protein YckC